MVKILFQAVTLNLTIISKNESRIIKSSCLRIIDLSVILQICLSILIRCGKIMSNQKLGEGEVAFKCCYIRFVFIWVDNSNEIS